MWILAGASVIDLSGESVEKLKTLSGHLLT